MKVAVEFGGVGVVVTQRGVRKNFGGGVDGNPAVCKQGSQKIGEDQDGVGNKLGASAGQ